MKWNWKKTLNYFSLEQPHIVTIFGIPISIITLMLQKNIFPFQPLWL